MIPINHNSDQHSRRSTKVHQQFFYLGGKKKLSNQFYGLFSQGELRHGTVNLESYSWLVRSLIRPRGEYTTATLLNQKKFKFHFQCLLIYSLRTVVLTIIKETTLCSMWRPLQKATIGQMQMTSDLTVLSPNWYI